MVSGWPGLKVDGYTERNKREREKPLEVVRMERLEGGVLICLFKGIFALTDLLGVALGAALLCYQPVANNPRAAFTPQF